MAAELYGGDRRKAAPPYRFIRDPLRRPMLPVSYANIALLAQSLTFAVPPMGRNEES
jgi:hypothetical protein